MVVEASNIPRRHPIGLPCNMNGVFWPEGQILY